MDIPVIVKGDGYISNIITLLRNLKIWDDTLIGLKIYYYDITLSLIAPINQTTPILVDFHKFDPKNPLLCILFNPK